MQFISPPWIKWPLQAFPHSMMLSETYMYMCTVTPHFPLKGPTCTCTSLLHYTPNPIVIPTPTFLACHWWWKGHSLPTHVHTDITRKPLHNTAPSLTPRPRHIAPWLRKSCVGRSGYEATELLLHKTLVCSISYMGAEKMSKVGFN